MIGLDPSYPEQWDREITCPECDETVLDTDDECPECGANFEPDYEEMER